MSERVRLIEHGIVLQDFSRIREPALALPIIAEAIRFMETQPRGEALTLTDVSGSSFNEEVITAIRGLAEHHRPWVRASAVVGLTPLMRIIYRAVVTLTRREIHVCETRAQAIAYLLSKRLSVPASAGDASRRKPSGPPGDPR